jgi:PmbA protein
MEFEAFKQAVAAAAAAHSVQEYELYYQAAESTDISVFRDEINEFTSSVEGGVCLRCVVGGKMGYASTEALSEQGAAALVRRAADNAASLEASENEEAEFLGQGGQTYAFAQEEAAALPATERLIATVHAAQKAVYAADEAVVDGTVSEVVAEKLRIALCNSNGLDLNYENTLTGVVQTAVVEQGGEKADGFGLQLGALDNIDLDALAAKTAAKARAKLNADVAPTGVYPVVFAPEAMCSLLAAYSGIFSAENAQKGLSRLAGKEGSVIAADCVTLVDDPAYPNSPLPMPFDAEGTPTRRKNVIENGVLTTLLYSLKTAAAAGRATTGNAAKRGYAAKISVSPFTLYLAPGALTEDELLAKAGNGVYINALGGLHAGANGITGDFSLQSAGFLIENGRKTRAVRSFTVAGNFYDLLRQITAVSDTVELPTATGITCFGSPSVLVEGLSVAGK